MAVAEASKLDAQTALAPNARPGNTNAQKHGLPVKEFSVSAESVRRLSETLFTLIKSGRLRLFPDQKQERELLALSVAQVGYGWRIDHAGGGYSDRAMALGMMTMEALAEVSKGHTNIRWN